jgi:hypothetical protein
MVAHSTKPEPYVTLLFHFAFYGNRDSEPPTHNAFLFRFARIVIALYIFGIPDVVAWWLDKMQTSKPV